MQLIDASPTKRFFVKMLTRDIELQDAILDLLDNCVDGIVRNIGGNSSPQPYAGYYARIEASPAGFTITDNCGGIPTDILLNSAFRQGRPDGVHPADAHTVGMYGIGMKRAIFKLGERSTLTTRNQDTAISVQITPEWLKDDKNWSLEPKIKELEVLPNPGTTIHVEQLYDNIAYQFSERESDFLSDLRDTIQQQYARILEKGFQITVNDHRISALDLKLYFDDTNAEGVQPYIFKGTINRVDVELVIGFHRRLASEKELEEEASEPRKSTDAGWTIICNDRVVLYKDRTRLTGWGLGSVPNYHNQFISISGQVEFRSTELFNLPLNTTKRGVDTGSEVYLTVLQEMMSGLKIFTAFTNKWKGKELETNQKFSLAKQGKPEDAIQAFEKKGSSWSAARNISNATNAKRYFPSLPTPTSNSPNRRIAFARHLEQIRTVANYLTGNPDTSPSDVGALCFDMLLKDVTKNIGERK